MCPRLYIGIVSDLAKCSYAKNVYIFQNYDVHEIGLSVDSVYTPSQPIKVNFKDDSQGFIHAYKSFLESLSDTPGDMNIDPERYRDGYTLFAFNLDMGGSAEAGADGMGLIKKGSVRLEMRFGTALPETVSLIVFSSYKTLFQMDKTRKVYTY